MLFLQHRLEDGKDFKIVVFLFYKNVVLQHSSHRGLDFFEEFILEIEGYNL